MKNHSCELIELTSYPKCGNTWLRYLLAKQFDLNVHSDIPDYHQRHGETKSLIKTIDVDSKTFGMYKSHVPNIKSIGPTKIALIYRHPLDVFLSCLNYFYINSWEEKFRNKKVKSVEEICNDGELDFYFETFLKEVGLNYYNGLLGQLSHYFDYLKYASNLNNVVFISYESLYTKREKYFEKKLNEIFGSEITVSKDLFSDVDIKTKNSGDKFYWKSKVENFRDYLSEGQVTAFTSKYDLEFEKYFNV